MIKIQSLTIGTTCLWMTLSAAVPFSVHAQMTPEQETQAVDMVSDLLANKIQSDSCDDFKAMLGKLQAGGDAPVDPTSTVGQVLTSVKAKPELQTIVVDKVGKPLIIKTLECNLITPEALAP